MFTHMQIQKYKKASLRDFASLSGVGHATLSRIQNGHDYKMSIAKKILPFLDKCPCCGKQTDNNKEQD
jgi:transcriptional regulator with XRE-family HTH domain